MPRGSLAYKKRADVHALSTFSAASTVQTLYIVLPLLFPVTLYWRRNSYPHVHFLELQSEVKVKVAQSCLTLCDPVTPWTIQSMESSRPEYWSG